MVKKQIKVVEEEIEQQEQPQQEPQQEQEQPMKQRKKLTPEALEKLQKARVMALEKRRANKVVYDEINKVEKIKKEAGFKEKLDEVETYKRVKDKVDSELKSNEIVVINDRMSKMMEQFNSIDGKLSSYIDERKQRKETKKARDIVNELPNAINKKMLEEELKKMELERFRKNVFGF